MTTTTTSETMEFAAPVAVVPGFCPPQASARSAAARRVLLAEDGLDNQQIVSLYLRTAGAEVLIAPNGRVAVERAMAQSPDLILMDIEMPELDGFAATAELRRRGYDRPIIALTAHSTPEDRQRCLAAGFTDFIIKPIDRGTLLAAIASCLAEEQPLVSAPSGGPSADRRRAQRRVGSVAAQPLRQRPFNAGGHRRIRLDAAAACRQLANAACPAQLLRSCSVSCISSREPVADSASTRSPGRPPRPTSR